jgi:AcrR family transcriptional regulator
MAERFSAVTQKPKIIEGFYRTILEEGFEGASIAKVAARIDMKPTLIIHYFGNRENLVLAGVDYVIDSYSRLLNGFKVRYTDPDKRLKALLETLWSREYYEKVHIAVAFSVIAVSFRNPRVQKKIKGLYTVFRKSLVKDLGELKEAGAVTVEDVEKAADVLISMVEGSRHFRHFHVKQKDVSAYNRSMIQAATLLLKKPEWGTIPDKSSKIPWKKKGGI